MDRAKCPEWKQQGKETDNKDTELGDELVLPWSGSALGIVDLGFVAGRIKPLVVGIIGPQNAGKTTLLAAWYLLIGSGQANPSNYRFAGSYSLTGWEAVASTLRWNPGQSPCFPPHTSSRGGRAPGLLHLNFRSDDARLRSYLFADAPGEWFQKWSINKDSVDAEGARWLAEHADVFLLIADCQALSGPNMGSARGSLQLLARRVAAERLGRPVALVWAKSDIVIAPEMKKTVRDAIFSSMPDTCEFSVSVTSGTEEDLDKGQGLLELFDWILTLRRGNVNLPSVSTTSSDPLFILGAK